METKLTEITQSYHSFVPDQILTAEQLNEFINYFDDQDRLSRIFLSGVGLVCGFNVSYGSNPANPATYGKITITQGAGITTDGDLLNLEVPIPDTTLENIDIPSVSYANYRVFSDDKAVYKPFFWKVNENESEVQLNLLELVPEGEEGGQPILSLQDPSDMVVLLYLENYIEDPDACEGMNCEDQGEKNVRKVRVLLVSQTDADYILSCDPMFNSHYLIETYLDLEEVAVQRVPVTAANSATFTALRSSYGEAIQAENTINRLKSGFNTMLKKLFMSAEATAIEAKLTALFGMNATMPTLYFQYRYDLLRDIADAYNELKELFLCAVGECCPDIHSFPKHLMLGKLMPTADDRFLKSYRHGFYKSPILRSEEACYDRFRHYVERTIAMLNAFIADTIPADNIRITPSSYRSRLENKAIPYYYNLQQPLLNGWNFDKYRVNKQRRNLSFRRSLLDPSPAIQFPLKYNLEPHNFLRIEGHQGLPFQFAMERINTLRDQYGLSFDLKALRININATDTINIDDYQCEFEDLNLMLSAWTQEHECLLGKVSYYFSAFSTKVFGHNLHLENFYHPVEKPAPGAKGVLYNAVLAEAHNKQGALGKILVDKFVSFKGYSGKDIVTQVNLAIDKLKFSATEIALIDATLRLPGEILSYAYVLLDKRPVELRQLTPAVIDRIAAAAESVCSSARQGIAKYQEANLTYRTRMMLTTLSTDLTALCCSAEKLQLIYDEIEKRKQEILLGLQLSKFREHHPGMEHLGGVEPGGTFILVYIGSGGSSVPAKTVVADFSLPYLCCSDCKPVNFIMTRPPAALRLSSDTFCIGQSTSPIELSISPEGGLVKFSPNVPGMTVNGNQLLIDPVQIPDNLLGKVIHFTVNDQVTDATLTLFKTPTVTIVAPADPIESNIVQFIAQFEQGTNTAGLQFLWEFGDGTTSTEQNPSHEYTLSGNNDQFTVTLTVTPRDGACPVRKQRTILFAVTNVMLEKTTFCSNDSEKFPFTIIPEGALVNLSGPGVQFVDEAYVFSPSQAGAGLITINCNGVAKLQLTVNPAPQANITWEAIDGNLVLTSNMQFEEAFQWSFTDADQSEVHPPITDDANPVIPFDKIDVQAGETIEVSLVVSNSCNKIEYLVSVIKPTPFSICAADSMGRINGFMEEMKKLVGSGELSPDGALTGNDALDFYSTFSQDPGDYLNGVNNGVTGNRMSDFIYRFYMEIKSAAAKGEATGLLLTAYFNLMYFGLTVVRCQTETAFKEQPIMDMIALLSTEMDPGDADSLQSIGLDVNLQDSNSSFLADILAMRQESSKSWNAINGLRNHILGN